MRRASVSSFGFGGSNAHLILEAYSPTTSHGTLDHTGDEPHNSNSLCNGGAVYAHKIPQTQDVFRRIESTPKNAWSAVPADAEFRSNNTIGIAPPLLVVNGSGGPAMNHHNSNTLRTSRKVFILSAKNEETCKKQVASFVSYLIESQKTSADTLMDDLAFTLTQRRSLFEWRVATSAVSPQELINSLQDHSLHAVLARKSPTIGMLFTGQGSQWYAMGRELMQYPVFASTMRDSDACIRALGADWSLLGETTRSGMVFHH